MVQPDVCVVDRDMEHTLQSAVRTGRAYKLRARGRHPSAEVPRPCLQSNPRRPSSLAEVQALFAGKSGNFIIHFFLRFPKMSTMVQASTTKRSSAGRAPDPYPRRQLLVKQLYVKNRTADEPSAVSGSVQWFCLDALGPKTRKTKNCTGGEGRAVARWDRRRAAGGIH